MPKTFNNANEAEAFSIDNKIGLFAGDNTPDIDVSGAPVGSRFYQTNGDVYKKTGAGDLLSDWTLQTSGGGSLDEALGFAIIGWD